MDVTPPEGWAGPEDDAWIEAEFKSRKRARTASSDRSNTSSIPEMPSDDNSMDVQGSEMEDLNVTPVVGARGILTSELHHGVEREIRSKEMLPPAAPTPPLRTTLKSLESEHERDKSRKVTPPTATSTPLTTPQVSPQTSRMPPPPPGFGPRDAPVGPGVGLSDMAAENARLRDEIVCLKAEGTFMKTQYDKYLAPMPVVPECSESMNKQIEALRQQLCSWINVQSLGAGAEKLAETAITERDQLRESYLKEVEERKNVSQRHLSVSERFEDAQIKLDQATERIHTLEEDCRRVKARCARVSEQSEERMRECVNLSRENVQSFDESAETVRASLCATEQELREARSAYTPQLFSGSENVSPHCPADGHSYGAAHIDGVNDILLRWIETTLVKEPSFMPLGEEREEFRELMCTLNSDLSHDVKSAMKKWRKDENELRSSYLSDNREGKLSEDRYSEACPPTDFNTALRHVFRTLHEIGKLYLEV